MSNRRQKHSTLSVLSEDLSSSIWGLLNFIYEILQRLIIYLFSPKAPPAGVAPSGPRIAVIGAGISGISAAAHCVGHGCDVVIFEARPRENLGGIWSRVNSTSSLQIYSLMYRFHPSVAWYKEFPNRQRVLEEAEKLWKRYGLQPKTRFETPVWRVERDQREKWIVNQSRDTEGVFDGVIVAIGTCGDPLMPHFHGQEQFNGKILHSSELDGLDVAGKKVLVVGGGASAIEAVEYAVAGKADQVDILARVSPSCPMPLLRLYQLTPWISLINGSFREASWLTRYLV